MTREGRIDLRHATTSVSKMLWAREWVGLREMAGRVRANQETEGGVLRGGGFGESNEAESEADNKDGKEDEIEVEIEHHLSEDDGAHTKPAQAGGWEQAREGAKKREMER